MGGLQLPDGLAQALAAQQDPGQGLPAGLAQDRSYGQDDDPLEVLKDCINGLPKVIAALPDPQDTQDAIQALHILSRIQTRLMKNQAGPGGPQPQGS